MEAGLSNSIEVSVEFSFKGENYSPSATIDLDEMMEKGRELADLHSFLATLHDIDTYSYMYEVMESQDIEFKNAKGLATECLSNGHFDIQKFQQLWQQLQELAVIGEIAKQHMHIDDLDQHSELKAALLAAYEAGKKEQ